MEESKVPVEMLYLALPPRVGAVNALHHVLSLSMSETLDDLFLEQHLLLDFE